ncbi:nuclear transport factor 2 family protein [Nocardia sp. NPDC004068]|uniref:nuclear transport factor 2 family protein n=1 Tax=Nocardia sp. NPDC004068 TaxID=3364303 RepID=UPI0036B93050
MDTEFEVGRVFDRYFRALDEKRFDAAHFATLFAPDGRIVRPNDAVTTGPAAIAASHARSFARFEATQHLVTGRDVTIEGDAAAVWANIVAIHLWRDIPADASMLDRSFTAGGVITAAAVRTAAGWRLTEVRNRILWRTGFFGDMARMR